MLPLSLTLLWLEPGDGFNLRLSAGAQTRRHTDGGHSRSIRGHVGRRNRHVDGGVTGITWYCSCGEEHARNFEALVAPFVRAAQAGTDLIL